MPFTAEEVTASVAAIVEKTSRTAIDPTGARRTSDTYTDLINAAAGVFLLSSNAPMYVLSLSARRLRTLVATQAAIAVDLRTYMQAAARNVLPVDDVSMLTGARVALAELEVATSARAAPFTATKQAPAYTRFDDQTKKFLDGPAQAVRSVGKVVPTPAEARAAIPAKLATLKENQQELQRLALTLSRGLDDYLSLALPAQTSRDVLQAARKKLQEHETTLSAQTPQERLGNIRQVTLDVLASRAAVKSLTTFAPLNGVFGLTGTGGAVGDATHPANPAYAQATTAGPYPVLPTSAVLELWLDGATTVSETLVLNPSIVPSIVGSVPEPIEIPSVADMHLTVQLGGIDYAHNLDLVALVGVGAYSATDIATAVNPLIATHNIRLTPAFSTIKLSGVTTELIDLGVSGGDWYLEVRAVGSIFVNQNIVVGDKFLFDTASTPGITLLEHTAWEVTAVNPVGANQDRVTVKRTMTPFLLPASPHQLTYSVGVKQQLTLEAIDDGVAIAQKMVLTVDAGSNPGATALGFIAGMSQSVRAVPADEMAITINSQTKGAAASAQFVASTQLFYGYSDPTDATVLQLSRVQRVARTITQLTTTFTISGTDFITAGVAVGDYATARNGPDFGDSFVVAAVTDSSITCFGVVSSGSFEYDVAPASSTYANADDVVSVSEGVNTLKYVVRSLGLRPTELVLQTGLPGFKNPQTGTAIEFRAELGSSFLRITSKSTLAASSVRVTGSAASLLGPSFPMPAHRYGTSNWLRFPSLPRAAETGDVLERYGSSYKTPDSTHTVLEIDRKNSLARVDNPVPTQDVITFDATVPPFAILRAHKQADFGVLKSRIEAWLLRLENQSNYFGNLNAIVNPLLLNSNPTIEQADTAVNMLAELYGGLNDELATLASAPIEATLDYALVRFVIDPVRDIDALLRGLRERGADRAAAILLEGRFSDFFRLTPETASYAGNMANDMRELMRNDLPVRRVDREQRAHQRALLEAREDDADNSTDVDPDIQPDYPHTGPVDPLPGFFSAATTK